MKTVTFTYLGAECEYNFKTRNLHIISKTSFTSSAKTSTFIISKHYNIEKKDVKTITFKHHNTKLPSRLDHYFSDYPNLEHIELEKLNFENVESINRFINNCPNLKKITLTHKKALKLTHIQNFITQTKETKSITIKNINAPNLEEVNGLLWYIEKAIKEITIEDITAPNIKTVDHLIDSSTIKNLDLTKIGNVNVTSIKTLIRNCTNLETLEIKPLKNTIEIETYIEKAPLLNTEIINKINKIEKLDPYFLTMTPKNEPLDLDKFKDISKLTTHLRNNLNENINKFQYKEIKIGSHKIKFLDYATIIANNIQILDKTEDEIAKEIILQSKNESQQNIKIFLVILKYKQIFKNEKHKKELTSKLTIIKNLK